MPRWDTSAQGTAGWLKARLGHLTASRMNDACSFTKKGEPTEARRKYMMELVAERMTDQMVEHYVTTAMQHGIDNEPNARDRYEEITGNLVMPAGFAVHDTVEYWGASPDGLIGHDGLMEIKCPATVNHLEIVMAGVVPDKYKAQMTTQCIITGREWCDFVSYDPRVPEKVQFFIRRFVPTPDEISRYTEQAMSFLSEVDDLFEMVINAS